MGSEIEKMYENAGVEYYKEICAIKNVIDKICNQECYFEVNCTSCPLNKTSFTAEKQIELIKLLMEQEDFSWTITQQGKVTEYAFYVGYEHSSGDFKEFTEALAGIINNLWQDLTEEERQCVKGILE